jgi:hypothetical protein
MKVRVPVISLALMAAAVACSKPSPVAKGANAVTAVPGASTHSVSAPAGGPPESKSGTTAAAAAPEATASISIPDLFQGRWGLTPQDCTSALGDAKGLLVINGSELRFYESRAVPTADTHFAGGVLAGDFRFTGEGQTWTKFERLERQKDTLVRTDSDPAASFTYAKC